MTNNAQSLCQAKIMLETQAAVLEAGARKDADLVTRLRALWLETGTDDIDGDEMDSLFALARHGAAAAARIAQLEAALREAKRGLDPYATYEVRLSARGAVDEIFSALGNRT